jgi:hypothetical protein
VREDGYRPLLFRAPRVCQSCGSHEEIVRLLSPQRTVATVATAATVVTVAISTPPPPPPTAVATGVAASVTSVTTSTGVTSACCRRRGRHRRLQKPMRSFALELGVICQVLWRRCRGFRRRQSLCRNLQECRERVQVLVLKLTTVLLMTGVCADAPPPTTEKSAQPKTYGIATWSFFGRCGSCTGSCTGSCSEEAFRGLPKEGEGKARSEKRGRGAIGALASRGQIPELRNLELA